MTLPNTPVPDELAAVREQIKALEQREEVLRNLLLTNPDVRTGASWLAEIKIVQQQRTDWKELRANYGNIVEQFTFPVEVTRVVLTGISDDGELISARKFRAAVQSGETQ